MKIVATIEARMTSSRLPAKVMLEVRQTPMISRLIRRLKSVRSLHSIVLATTVNPQDDVLADVAERENVSCFRGSETDVMGRVLGAAKSVGGDVIVEVTGDCPILDPDLVEQMVQIFLSNKADYVSNAHVRSYPDGMDVQVFWTKALERSYSLTDDVLDREHVTLHIRNNPELFHPIHVVAGSDCRWPKLGLTLDEYHDFLLLEAIIEALEPGNFNFGCAEVVRFLKNHRSLLTLNEHVLRKGDH